MNSITDIYTSFVKERHAIWERRQAGTGRPWTLDPVLLSRKYTNVFRVLDPGSQFVITDLECMSSSRTLMRIFLYRNTNLPAAWRAYRDAHGSYPRLCDLDRLQSFWTSLQSKGSRVFSGAYIVWPPAKGDKIAAVVDFTRRVFSGSFPDRFKDANTQQERFRLLNGLPGVGNFMAMQILTDWGYTRHCPEDRENEFIVAGPGARKGANALRVDLKPEDTIRVFTDYWRQDESVSVTLPDGSVRYPSLMDVQNTFCELSKHYRHRQKSPHRRVVPYAPAHPGEQDRPRYPASWLAS